MLSGIVTLFSFTVIGNVINDALSLPIPGSVIGLVLLVIYLQISGTDSESLNTVSQLCIRYLGVLFIPGCVGVFFLGDLLAQQWLPITLAILVATPISLVATALLVQWLLNLGTKSEHHHG